MDEEKTRSSENMILQKDIENFVNGASKKQGSLKLSTDRTLILIIGKRWLKLLRRIMRK